LITVALSTSIGARAENVWRALTDPSERPTWDERILGEVTLAHSLRPKDRRRSRTGDAASGPRPLSDSAARSSADSVPNHGVRSHSRWRFLFGGVPMVLRDDVLSSEPLERQVSRVTIGSMHFDQTLTLYSEDDETGPHTRLAMKLVADNSIAVIGEIIARGDVQKIVMEYVDTTLRQVQKHCEH
jgi:hypothetical protein